MKFLMYPPGDYEFFDEDGEIIEWHNKSFLVFTTNDDTEQDTERQQASEGE